MRPVVKLVYTDRVNEKANAIGRVRLSVRPFVLTLSF